MPCMNPDGKPTASGFRILRAIKDGLGSPEEIAEGTGVPIFKTRSGLREMETAGLVSSKEGKYQLEAKGKELADTVTR
jgi:DNA-binding IclR family transcriptional regulator